MEKARYIAEKKREGAEFSRDGKSRKYTQVYQIIGGAFDEAPTMANCAGLPQPRSTYNGEPFTFLKSLKINRVGSSHVWEATAEFEYNIENKSDDPTQKPWDISFDTWSRTETVIDARIIQDDAISQAYIPVKNSAGEYFANPATIERHYKSIKLTHNVKTDSFDPA
jgi:hypothetical protein